MFKYASVIGLAITLFLTATLASLFAPGNNYALLHVKSNSDLSITLIQKTQGSAEQCEKHLFNIRNAMLSTCSDCTIGEQRCTETLTSAHKNWLSNSAIDKPSIVINNGVVIYEANDNAVSQAACELSAKQIQNQAATRQARCSPPGENRTDNATRQANHPNMESMLKQLTLAGACVLALLVFISVHVKKKAYLLKLVGAGTDSLTLLSALVIIDQTLAFDFTTYVTHLALIALTIAAFWIAKEHYAQRHPFWDELREIFVVLSIVLLLMGTLTVHAGTTKNLSQVFLLWGVAFALIPLGRASMRLLLDRLGLWKQPALIIGTGENAIEACQAIESESNLGYRIIGFASIGNAKQNEIKINKQTFSVIQLKDNVEAHLEELGNPKVIIALESLMQNDAQQLTQKIAQSQPNVHVIPSLRGLPLFGTELSHFFSHEVLFLTIRNNLARRSYQWIKRAFDILVAGMLLICLSPLFIALTLMIRKTGGSAFFGHTRVGQNGKAFKCLKFRSMRPDADKVLKDLLENDPVARAEWEKDFKLKNDPRVTAVGKFLRKTSLDELPQLINVLKGEMSLVGPRPVIEKELERYGDAARFYLEAKPGVTGLWQVSGRNDTTYAERVSLDSWYVQNWSLWYDIAILFKTIDVVLNRRGAY